MNDGNYGCDIFVDFQKDAVDHNIFDTVDHNIFLRKLEHYGFREISNKWFASYHSNRKQLLSLGFTPAGIYMFKVYNRNTRARC